MYNSTHYWYTVTANNSFRDRLSLLDIQRLVIYSVGCVTYAKNLLVSDIRDDEHNDYASVIKLLDAFWTKYPNSSNRASLVSLADYAEELVSAELGPEPDSKFLKAPGAEQLLWATLYCLTLGKSDRPYIAAYDSLDASYFALYVRFGKDQDAIAQGRMQEIETATKECSHLLQFHLHFLNIIESSSDIPHDYAAIAAFGASLEAR